MVMRRAIRATRSREPLGWRLVRAVITAVGLQFVSLVGQPGGALADCAAGDGAIVTPVTCTTPQVLTASTGTIAAGATLTTGPGSTAYTISSNNASLTNSGVVASQGSQALLVNGSGNTLTNSGSISASQGTAIVVNSSAGLNITNAGDITGGGGTAISYDRLSSGGQITQSAGTIQGSVLLSGFGTTLRITGGAINGAILDQTPASGAAGSSQGRGGTVNFDLGTGSFTTNGRIEVGAVNVQSGTVVLQNDVYVSGGIGGLGLTNSAMLQINGVRTITGSFVQTASGTLVMQVSPQASSQLNIARLPFSGGRTASLAGTLELVYQPGTYQQHTYTLISTDTGGTTGSIKNITGSFSNITGVVPTPGLAQTVTIGANDVELALSGVAQPTNDTVFPATTTSLILNGQRLNSLLLDRLAARQTGGSAGPEAANEPGPPRLRLAQAGNLAALGEIASALPKAMGSDVAWFRGIGDFVSLSGNAAAPGFNGSSGGFLAGFDRPVSPDLTLGIAGGYLHSDVSEHSATTGQVDSGRVAAYGGGWWGPTLLTGIAGYAYDRIASVRNITAVGTATQGHDGHEFSLAGQWSLPTRVAGIAGTAVLTPKLGVQFLHLSEDGFKETGAGGFALSSAGTDTDSFQPYVGVAVSETFVAADGTLITPEIRLGYNRETLSTNRAISLAAIDGTPFLARGVKPSRDMLSAGIGVTLRAQDNMLLYAEYDAIVPTGNTTDHRVAAGLRLRF
jgi:outer membrane autotransporter protein